MIARLNGQSLPDGWVWTTLDKLTQDMRNGISGLQNKEGNGFPVSRIETISSGVIDISRVGYLDNLDSDVIDKYRLRYGDILFSNINSDIHIGKTALYRLAGSTLLHGMNLLLIRVFASIVLPEYIHYLCNYYRFDGYFISIAQHAVNL